MTEKITTFANEKKWRRPNNTPHIGLYALLSEFIIGIKQYSEDI